MIEWGARDSGVGRGGGLMGGTSFLVVTTVVSGIVNLLCGDPLSGVVKDLKVNCADLTRGTCVVLLVVTSFDVPRTMSGLVSRHVTLGSCEGTRGFFGNTVVCTVIVNKIINLFYLFKTKLVVPRGRGSTVPTLRVLTPAVFLSNVLKMFEKCFRTCEGVVPASVSRVVRRMFGTTIDLLTT